jgi:hypothetical protein
MNDALYEAMAWRSISAGDEWRGPAIPARIMGSVLRDADARGHLRVDEARRPDIDVMLMMQPLRLCRIAGRTA